MTSNPFYRTQNQPLVEIPADIDGMKVTAIGNTFEEAGAFQDCITLTSVIIPGGLTEIQDNAFQGYTSLKTVTIPASVTAIYLL